MSKHSEYWGWIPTGRVRWATLRTGIWPFRRRLLVLEAEETTRVLFRSPGEDFADTMKLLDEVPTRWEAVDDPSKLPPGMFLKLQEAVDDGKS